MGLIVILLSIVALAVIAGQLYAAEVERRPARRARRSTVPPELRRRFIGGPASLR
jgi:hypothetical protein